MHNFEASYKLILEELGKLTNKDNLYFKPIAPKISDLELIGLIIWAEYKSIDPEHQLFRDLKDLNWKENLNEAFITGGSANCFLT